METAMSTCRVEHFPSVPKICLLWPCRAHYASVVTLHPVSVTTIADRSIHVRLFLQEGPSDSAGTAEVTSTFYPHRPQCPKLIFDFQHQFWKITGRRKPSKVPKHLPVLEWDQFLDKSMGCQNPCRYFRKQVKLLSRAFTISKLYILIRIFVFALLCVWLESILSFNTQPSYANQRVSPRVYFPTTP